MKDKDDTLIMFLALVGLVALMVLAIFLFQSWFHPYNTDCHRVAEGLKCAVKYHTYWQPTLSI